MILKIFGFLFRKDHYGKFIGLMCFYVRCYDCYDGAGDGVASAHLPEKYLS